MIFSKWPTFKAILLPRVLFVKKKEKHIFSLSLELQKKLNDKISF